MSIKLNITIVNQLQRVTGTTLAVVLLLMSMMMILLVVDLLMFRVVQFNGKEKSDQKIIRAYLRVIKRFLDDED